MREVVVSQSGLGSSTPIVLDRYIAPANVAWQAVITAGTPTYQVEFTEDSPWNYGSIALYNANAPWFNIQTGAPTTFTANAASNVAYPARAIRITITAGASSAVTFTVVTAGITT